MKVLKNLILLWIIIAVLLCTNIITGKTYLGVKKFEKLKEGYELNLEDTDTFTFFKPLYSGYYLREPNLWCDREEFKKIIPDEKINQTTDSRITMWVANVDNYSDFANGQELVDKLLAEEGDYILQGLHLSDDQVTWLRKNIDVEIRDVKTGKVLLPTKNPPSYYYDH